jgi:hypothetical protein
MVLFLTARPGFEPHVGAVIFFYNKTTFLFYFSFDWSVYQN